MAADKVTATVAPAQNGLAAVRPVHLLLRLLCTPHSLPALDPDMRYNDSPHQYKADLDPVRIFNPDDSPHDQEPYWQHSAPAPGPPSFPASAAFAARPPVQQKILALNPKFVPRPRPTLVQHVSAALDDFDRRLQLRVAAENQPTLHKHFGVTHLEVGQPHYVPTFHLPNPDASGPPLIDKIERALEKVRDRIEVEVISRQTLLVRPNVHDADLKGLLRLLADNSILAVPADKNLGLCLVTAEWYHNTVLSLLVNASYVEEEPDHLDLLLSLRTIVEATRDLVTKQQYLWLNRPCVLELKKVPVLKVIPKIHKLPHSGRPIVPTFGTLFANTSAWVDHQIKPLLDKFPWILRDSHFNCSSHSFSLSSSGYPSHLVCIRSLSS
ncbi:hypothetical protein B0H10DRAFT_2219091 [Mycena sp. CBHHK59/15]|nr:hypothetical protein B0H10DRAFT_2219091 [Mycena sp. CBHHK59/15]